MAGGAYPAPREFHGATIGITDKSGTVMHEDCGISRPVLMRSYSDGIRIGCTFISNEALGRIWGMHSKYLKHEDYVEHQSGSYYQGVY